MMKVGFCFEIWLLQALHDIETKSYKHNWLHYFDTAMFSAWLQLFCLVLFLDSVLWSQIANYFYTPNLAQGFIVNVISGPYVYR